MRAIAAAAFAGQGTSVAGVEVYGHGIIHDTYLVTLRRGAGTFILQRINTMVFNDPAAVMSNLRLVCGHVSKRLQTAGRIIAEDWQMVRPLAARDGGDLFVDAAGGTWRALSFIRNAVPLEQISSLHDAGEVGRALGIFHWLASDLEPGSLQVTLPGFHNIEHYLARYETVVQRSREQRRAGSDADAFCAAFIAARRQWAPVLEKVRRAKLLKTRVIHGDPKINNIMVSRDTGRAVSIIDLDTVMPGLVQYDIGDCLRSCCNTLGEETADLSRVRFDLARCEAVLRGYAKEARRFLTGPDYDFFYEAVRLLPFELGLRFYTDFLENNVYFKANRPEHNLERAMVQFKLVESIEQQEERIREVIAGCRAFAAANGCR